MSRQFSIQTTLRMVPNALLSQFFLELGHDDLNIPWTKLGEREIAPILAALSQLPHSDFDHIEGTLHEVFELACETGTNAILEGARLLGEDNLAVVLPGDAGPYCMAMWALINRRAAFDKALLLHQIDGLSWWRKRHDLPRKAADKSSEAIARLGHAVSHILMAAQGRGQQCTVEICPRGPVDCFFSHPDDFVQNVSRHDDEGHLTPDTFRRTFDVVFAYNAVEGTLELFAKVPPKLKPELEAVFARAILGIELGPLEPDPAYELNGLKDDSFSLQTDPADRVRVRVRKIRLASKFNGRRVLLEIPDDDDLHKAIRECLNRDHLPLSQLNVSLVTFTFEFQPLEGRKPGTLTFDVAYPRSCSLRNQRAERIAIAEKYLKLWGIDVQPTQSNSSAMAS